MSRYKKKLGAKGFSHIELIIIIVTAVCLFGIGYFIVKQGRSNTTDSYTSLATFTSEGVSFSERACIASQTDTIPDQMDTIHAQITVDNEAGPRTEITKKGKTSGGYNPLAYYSVNGGTPKTFDNWVTGLTSTISFNLPPMLQTSSFNLGIEPSSVITSSGSSQLAGSLSLCSPASKVAHLSTISTSSTKQSSTTAIPATTPTAYSPSSTTTSPASSTSTSKTTTSTSKSSSATSVATPSTTIKKTTSPTPTQAVVPSPTISLRASSTSIIAGSSTTLTWSTTNATSCTASNSWSGSKSTSGSASTGIFNSPSNYTYTLDCIGSGGNVSANTTIGVTGTSMVTAGNSKTNCLELNNPNGMIDDSQMSAITAVTGVTYNCVITYNNPMPTWPAWDTPWAFNSYYNWGAWIAQSPNHQIDLGVDLIPQSIENNSNPLTWEQQCDAGDFNSYATTLGENLVSGGGSSVTIRLGIEANGTWEADYVGTTTQEQNAWAQCYDNEVTALRAVPGSHFLFVWNPNICTDNLPLNEWYPGNSYVDIIGADAYDEDCWTQQTVSEEGWSAFANDTAANNPNNPDFPSLNNIVSFAAANGKPFALPEWGESTSEPDDPTYVTDMGNLVKNTDTSFEAWFDCGCSSTQPLGTAIPLSTAAYKLEF